MVRVVTWNVNSLRTRADRVEAWLARHEPDVVLLQETKCPDEDVRADRFAALGYEVAHWGRDHWNGVGILSRVGLRDVRRGFPGPQRPPFDEARLIRAMCGGVRVYSVYVPNGRALDDPHYLYKLVWLERLRSTLLLDGLEMPTIVAGDFNVAPTDLDIYAPARWRHRTHASPPERAAVLALADLGLRDVTREHLPGAGVYTWWSYRPGQVERNQGLRIDLVWCTDDLAERVQRVWIDLDERRGERPSDHAPVVVELE